MHLAVLKNQGCAQQSWRTHEIAVIGAITGEYARVARLKRNDVLLGIVENRFQDMAAVDRVLGQDRVDEMRSDEAAEWALVSNGYQFTAAADGGLR